MSVEDVAEDVSRKLLATGEPTMKLIEARAISFREFLAADLAADFIEEEVGQYDWAKNLQHFKEKLGPDRLHYAISMWMDTTGREGNPSDVMIELDYLLKNYSGLPWQQMLKTIGVSSGQQPKSVR